MLCKKCSYILTGKENFCPNCGTDVERNTFSFSNTKEQTENRDAIIKKAPQSSERRENGAFPSRVPSERPYATEKNIINIDSDNIPPIDNKRKKETKEKDNSSGKILALILICCTLAVTAFGLADYFGITPGLVDAVSTFSHKKNVTQGNADRAFSHDDTIVAPDVEHRAETAYVFSGEGLILRKGPANTFAPLHSLTDLTQVSVIGSSLSCRGWVYVYCAEKDSYGWLDGGFLCSDVIAESSLSEKNASVDEIPTNYYSEGNVI